MVARQLQKSYGKHVALKDFTLNLYPGQLVALLGPNGAGKSTLMQVLSGLFMPDKGELSVLGHDMRGNAPKALSGLGIVFQQISLDLDLSIRANLLFHTDLHGIPRAVARERIEQGLAQHGLQAQSATPVRALSGGNRRKVELIRALLHQPRLLLMDEATVGLDPASRQALMVAVKARVRAGELAALWATHLVDEVIDADRLVVLNRGDIVFDGEPQALIAQSGGLSLEQAFLALCEATPSASG